LIARLAATYCKRPEVKSANYSSQPKNRRSSPLECQIPLLTVRF
jgi:hypothetical protein